MAQAIRKRIREQQPEPEPKLEMWLEVGIDGHLEVRVRGILVGDITPLGECSFLNNKLSVDAYNQWRKAGMHVREQEPELWRGGLYMIDEHTKEFMSVFLGIYTEYDKIYDFDNCSYFENVKDDNIQRHEHNLRPIGF